jgi:deoxyhypusine synthase
LKVRSFSVARDKLTETMGYRLSNVFIRKKIWKKVDEIISEIVRIVSRIFLGIT